MKPASVSLVGVNRYGLSNLAALFLRNWARRDAALSEIAIDVVDLGYDLEPDEAARRILESNPALVGFTCFLWNSGRVAEIARRLKQRAPGVLVALGGPEIAPAAGRALEDHPDADFAASGEGEEVFRGLLHALFLEDRPLAEVPGLAYRDGGSIVVRDEAEPIDLELMPPVYAGPHGAPIAAKGMLLEASRGCPFLCSFCDWGPRKMRYVPLPAVERELEALVGKATYVFLCDADPLMDKARGLSILDAFLRISRGTPCTLHFETDPAFVGAEAAELIAREPWRFHMSFGIQSTSPEVLKAVKRVQDLRRVEENLERLRRVAPDAQYSMSLVYGLPGDTLERFRGTLDWILKWPAQRACASQLMVIPGSDLSEDERRWGLTHQPRSPYQVYETASMNKADMRRARELAFYNEMLHYVRPCLETLFGGGRLDAPEGSRVARLEAWIERLKESGVDLTFGAPVLETDESRLDERSAAAAERIARDPLLLAALLQTTRETAERHAQRL